MVVPRRILILTIAFLIDAVAGGLTFAIFRWVGDQDPPNESLQLGLLAAAGSLLYLITCLMGSPLRKRLHGYRIVALGLFLGLIALVLLRINRSVWPMYPLWALTMVSFAMIFPSVTAWIRRGRTGHDLRRTLFLYCMAWMSGVTAGAFFGSWLYYLSPGYIGAGYVYMCSFAIYLLCLTLLAIMPARRSVPGPEPTSEHPDTEEQVEPELARTFLRIGWIGNMILMLCVVSLLNLFKKITTDMHIDPFMDGLLAVVFRIASITAAGLMMVGTSWRYRRWSLILSSFIGMAGLCIVGLAENYWIIMLGFGLVGVLTGHHYYCGVYYSLSSVSSSDAVGQSDRAAVNESFFSIGAIVGAGLGGLAGDIHVRLPYFFFAAVVMLGLYWQMMVLKKSRARLELSSPA